MTGDGFSGSWWGQRWIEALERLSTAWQNRLPRGREYAKKGHVISLAVSSGKIGARVQGSRSKPYVTTIEVPPLRGGDWDRVIKTLASEARFPAQLLVGVMPTDIDDAFAMHNVSLFPVRNSELLGSCTCPDKARPCKHIAAVHYAFGQALDRDPFLLFAVRGADRGRLLRGFNRAWFGDALEDNGDDPGARSSDPGVAVAPLDADTFNRSPVAVEPMSFAPITGDPPLLILDRLAAPRAWSLPVPISGLLGPVYEEVTRVARAVAVEGFDDGGSRTFDAFFEDAGDGEGGDLDEEAEASDAASQTGSGAATRVSAPLPLGASVPGAATQVGGVSRDAFRPLPASAPAAAPVPTQAVPSMLPSALALAKKIAVQDAAGPEPARGSVIVRKGVATVARRRKGSGSESGEARRLLSDVPPPLSEVPRPLSEPPRVGPAPAPLDAHAVAVRARRDVGDGPTIVRRRGSGGIIVDGSSPLKRAARVQDLVVELDEAMAAGQFALACRAATELWSDGPSVDRFVRLLAASAAADRTDEVLRREGAKLSSRARDRSTGVDRAEAMMMLCCGEQKLVADLAYAAGKRVWSDDGPALVVVLYVARALFGAQPVPSGSALAQVWETAPGLSEGPPGYGTAGLWIERCLREHPPPPSLFERLSRCARELMTWGLGAQLAVTQPDLMVGATVALAEGVEVARLDGGGAAVLAAVHESASRRRRLADLLEKTAGASPVLS